MNKVLYLVGGGLLGWYLGTQQEAKTRKLYEKLKLEAQKLREEVEEITQAEQYPQTKMPPKRGKYPQGALSKDFMY